MNYGYNNTHENYNRQGGFGGRNPNADFGKKFRQMEQDRNKHDKAFREAEMFWYTQERNVETDKMRGGPPRKGRRRLDEEEFELFKDNHGGVGIAFDQYDNIPVERTGNDVEEIPVISTFAEIFDVFQMPQFAQRNVELLKYTRPTPVQKYALPAGLCGRDLLCCAQTGSGKTATFILPIAGILDQETAIENMRDTFTGPAAPRAVILAPTRELCSQIYNEAIKFCHRSPFRITQIYGGVDAKSQLIQLSRGVDILVATPGRLIDFVDRGILTLSKVEILVLDEADRMLDMGFEPQIRMIVEQRDMPSERITWMFSATFNSDTQKLSHDFLYNYVWVAVGRVGAVTHTVSQAFRQITHPNDKQTALMEVLRAHPDDLVLVFVAKKRTASWLCQFLWRNGIRGVTEIHGDLSQNERERSLAMFKTKQCRILCATDVAARGLDISGVGLVINYDMPTDTDSYVHRIGRAGRIGRTGSAISFYISSKDDPMGGNSNLLKDLVELLQHGETDVPQFLMDEYNDKYAPKQTGPAHGKKQPGRGGFSFGGRDVRAGQFGNARGSFGGKGKGKGFNRSGPHRRTNPTEQN
jgi:ATP-dependent RNA helicase DDX3X